MDKVKGLSIIIVVIVSILITILIAGLLLDTTGKVNQGNYRVSDIVIESSATVTEVQDTSVKIDKLSGLVFDVSQTNEITIMVEANTKASSIMLDNINVSEPKIKGKMSLMQKDYEKNEITPDFKSMPIRMEEEDGQYKIVLLIDNENLITDRSVSDDKEKIPYSAEILKLWDISVSDVQFDLSFDLIITDDAGTKSKTNIKLNMPTDETLEEGMSILRQDASKNVFTIVK